MGSSRDGEARGIGKKGEQADDEKNNEALARQASPLIEEDSNKQNPGPATAEDPKTGDLENASTDPTTFPFTDANEPDPRFHVTGIANLDCLRAAIWNQIERTSSSDLQPNILQLTRTIALQRKHLEAKLLIKQHEYAYLFFFLLDKEGRKYLLPLHPLGIAVTSIDIFTNLFSYRFPFSGDDAFLPEEPDLSSESLDSFLEEVHKIEAIWCDIHDVWEDIEEHRINMAKTRSANSTGCQRRSPGLPQTADCYYDEELLAKMLNRNDLSDWPPQGINLSDAGIIAVIRSTLPGRQRYERYPTVFTASGLQREYINKGRAAKSYFKESKLWVYDVAFGIYQFFGDEGRKYSFNRDASAVTENVIHARADIDEGSTCQIQSNEYNPDGKEKKANQKRHAPSAAESFKKRQKGGKGKNKDLGGLAVEDASNEEEDEETPAPTVAGCSKKRKKGASDC